MAVTLTGCEFQEVEIVSIEDIELNAMERGRIDGTLHIVLENPNAYTITVKSAAFELFTGNTKVGNAELSQSFKIDGQSTRSYPVQLSGNLSNIMGGGFAGLAGMLLGKKPKLIVKGELKAGNFFFTRKVPVEVETDLPLSL